MADRREGASGLDPQVVAAQKHNASRMTVDQLRRELFLADRRPEQPEIRVRWRTILREELAIRG